MCEIIDMKNNGNEGQANVLIDCFPLLLLHVGSVSGADPGFDQGGPQIVTGLKLPFWGLSFGAGASFLVVRGGPGPPGPPPGSAPGVY